MLTSAGENSPLVRPTADPIVERSRMRPAWEGRYRAAVLTVDAAALLLAAAISQLIRFGGEGATPRGVPYTALSALLVLVWLAVLAASRAYEARLIGVGAEEFRRVFDASVRLLAVVATISYVLRLELARGYVAIALPVGTGLLILGRYVARKALHRLRRDGRACYRVVAVGERRAVQSMVREAHRWPSAGITFVGACVPGREALDVGGLEVPLLGAPEQVVRVLAEQAPDAVAVAGGWAVGALSLRELAWELEGSGIDLLVAPSLTDVAGPRISVRPVAGLPLLHVQEPELTGIRRVVKSSFDRAGAAILLVLSMPVLILTAAAIRLDSPGPVFYRQLRVGRLGREFNLWKLRTMAHGAHEDRAAVEALNEADGAVFKIRADPRITRSGRILRRFSLDELPQLWNVLVGDMSLVGPRPPLPDEVATYQTHVHRRLLVRPGMTGLWQVNGRSDLPWDESVRLDLHYVENWSIAVDLLILAKTIGAVVRGRGAY